jgi:hypothetical protein
MIGERVNAGLARARAQGKVLGRQRDNTRVPEIKRMLAKGVGINKIARTLGCGVSMLQRVIRPASDRPAGSAGHPPSPRYSELARIVFTWASGQDLPACVLDSLWQQALANM